MQNLFQISGVVRAFKPVDRAHLKARLIALEKDTDIRCGITETAPDSSVSAFASESSNSQPRLVRSVSGLARRASSGFASDKPT